MYPSPTFNSKFKIQFKILCSSRLKLVLTVSDGLSEEVHSIQLVCTVLQGQPEALELAALQLGVKVTDELDCRVIVLESRQASKQVNDLPSMLDDIKITLLFVFYIMHAHKKKPQNPSYFRTLTKPKHIHINKSAHTVFLD